MDIKKIKGHCCETLTALLCLCLLSPLFGYAQSDTLKLNEVKIIAHKVPLNSTSATPAQILGGKALERLNSLSVADAIRYFSGVQLKDYGGVGGLKTINVRSMGTNHTAVYYDGMQLGNAQNGQVDLGKLSLDNIDQIELYSAQKNTIYLPARGFASASALYLQSKRPYFEPDQNKHVRIAFKTGSFGLISPSVRWEQKLTNNTNALFSTEWRKASGKYKFRSTNGVYDTTAIRENGAIESLRVEAGLNGALSDSSKWDVKLYAYGSDEGLPGAVVQNKFYSPQHQSGHNIFLQSSFGTDERKAYAFTLRTKYAYDYSHYTDPEIIKVDGLTNNKYKQQEFYFSAANRYRVNKVFDMALSGDFQWNTLNANIYRFSYPTRYTLLAAMAADLHLQRFNVQASLLGTYVDDKVEQYVAAGNKRELTPAIAASFKLLENEDLRLRAHYKRIFRMPTFNDLYYTFMGTTYLKPEYTNQYNIGIMYNKSRKEGWLKHFAVQTDVYYNQVKDKIIAAPGKNLLRWMMINLDEVSIKGVETNVQSAWLLKPELWLNLSFNYTYQQAVDLTPGADNYKQQIPYTPKNSGSFLMGLEWKSIGLNYSYIYTGARYDQKTNIPENYLEPWYTHDLSLSWRGRYRKAGLKLSAEVNDLFNQYYEVVRNFPMPGRSYRFTLSVNY